MLLRASKAIQPKKIPLISEASKINKIKNSRELPNNIAEPESIAVVA